MNESKTNEFYDQNQALYNELFDASIEQKKRIYDRLLLANTGLIMKAVKNSGWKQYETCEYDDIVQTAKMYFIQVLSARVEAGERTYPEALYPEILRQIQENMSKPYSNSGVAIPYSSKKVMQRNDYEKTKKIGASTSYTNDMLESSQLNKMEADMVNMLNSMPMEDKICTIIVIQNILNEQTAEMRQMFEDRYYNELTYAEIGEKQQCSEDHARYVLKCLTQKIRKELELDT